MKRVAEHYGRTGLIDAIDAALRAAGVDPEEPTLDHLAPVDHFHSLGHFATLELARLAGISADDEVLDIGGGLGGPARTLASQFGCRVTVLDLTPDFCRTGEILTRRLALDRLVRFRVGDALQPPFTPASFDVVWTQHSTMNIPDKPGLYRHAHSLLRPGGRLAMHEIVAGPAGPPHFPVPWAFEPSISSLAPASALRSTIQDTGFDEKEWIDLSGPTLAWVRERLGSTSPPLVGMHLLLGEKARLCLENVERGFAEDRLQSIMAVWER